MVTFGFIIAAVGLILNLFALKQANQYFRRFAMTLVLFGLMLGILASIGTGGILASVIVFIGLLFLQNDYYKKDKENIELFIKKLEQKHKERFNEEPNWFLSEKIRFIITMHIKPQLNRGFLPEPKKLFDFDAISKDYIKMVEEEYMDYVIGPHEPTEESR